jgi:hypothetical protein
VVPDVSKYNSDFSLKGRELIPMACLDPRKIQETLTAVMSHPRRHELSETMLQVSHINKRKALVPGQSENEASNHSLTCSCNTKWIVLFSFRCLREMARFGCVFFWLVECIMCVIQ